jgi:hypothetical protein
MKMGKPQEEEENMWLLYYEQLFQSLHPFPVKITCDNTWQITKVGFRAVMLFLP